MIRGTKSPEEVGRIAQELARAALLKLAHETQFSHPPAILREDGWTQKDYQSLGECLETMADATKAPALWA